MGASRLSPWNTLCRARKWTSCATDSILTNIMGTAHSEANLSSDDNMIIWSLSTAHRQILPTLVAHFTGISSQPAVRQFPKQFTSMCAPVAAKSNYRNRNDMRHPRLSIGPVSNIWSEESTHKVTDGHEPHGTSRGLHAAYSV